MYKKAPCATRGNVETRRRRSVNSDRLQTVAQVFACFERKEVSFGLCLCIYIYIVYTWEPEIRLISSSVSAFHIHIVHTFRILPVAQVKKISPVATQPPGVSRYANIKGYPLVIVALLLLLLLLLVSFSRNSSACII